MQLQYTCVRTYVSSCDTRLYKFASAVLCKMGGQSSSISQAEEDHYKKANQEFLHQHSTIMNEQLAYDVYLIRNEGLHHFLIIQCKEKQVCIRLELTQQWGKTIFLHSNYNGTLKDEDRQGKIHKTLGSILNTGRQIIRDYKEEYQLFHQNCQEFCNTYLRQLGLSGYITHSLMARGGWALLRWWYGV